ncbi:RING-type E3 ubiquitin transferase [Ranunculus cassubicifolius]
MESPLSPLHSPTKNQEQNSSFFLDDNGFSKLFLIFFGMFILYMIVKCKGECIENNDDIERGNQVGDQIPHSNLFVHYFYNSHWRFYYRQSMLIEMNRVRDERKSQLILELLENFQEQSPRSSYKDLLPSECAVCLDIFEEDDKSWILPRCKHVFHDGCIREWLKALGSTCPICRSVIIFV